MSSKLQPSQSCNFLDEVSSMKELASHGLLYTLSQSCKEYNDVVFVLAPNIPAMYEMHFAVPMAGAVLNTINTRLDANNIATILRHSEAKVLFVNYEYVPKAKEALELLIAKKYHSSPPLLILIDDINSPTSIQFVELEYEQLVYNDDSNFFPEKIHDEWAPIALNYTSGTTSASKGVVYSHRGAYLSKAKPSERFEIKSIVEILTGGAPPPPSLIEKIESLGFHVMHAYGLTEATGSVLVCEWQQHWNQLPKDEQAQLKARLGVIILTLEDVDVKKVDTMESVSRDGKTMGEIVLRGSSIMKGYFKDLDSTLKAFSDGWFHTGDVGVIHKDGYLEIKDRSKYVIISGGENISSVDLEYMLYKHPRVLEAAVVAMPHPRWGESPCAFVVLKKF
ncbi:putative acyl-activating enzyme 22 [Glycine soja]|uniref:Putative acyl-activating enzyme 22 n=1 Tax=Glycine soja TaxID=3848 RepID=A0A445LTH1_GLYSO|nr:putative acyl-activating enzyme 22 [Glycine soja]